MCSWGSDTGGGPRQAASLEHRIPESLFLPDEAQPCDSEARGQTLAAQCAQEERWVVESLIPSLFLSACLGCHSHDIVLTDDRIPDEVVALLFAH